MDWAGFRLSTEILPSPPDRLRARAVIRNTTRRFLSARLPGCLPWLRAYRDGLLVWDQWRDSGCETALRLVELPPDGEETKLVVLPAAEILGDSLPDGVYQLTAFIPRAWTPGPPRPEMELLLSRVRLARPAEPR